MSEKLEKDEQGAGVWGPSWNDAEVGVSRHFDQEPVISESHSATQLAYSLSKHGHHHMLMIDLVRVVCDLYMVPTMY
jgi:hypothetical protein